MNEINFNVLRDRAYKIACEHGFHNKELSNEHCLCLVISELMEAVEADRKGKTFGMVNNDFDNYCRDIDKIGFKEAFEKWIKDTICDELADAVIRLLDLAGMFQIDLSDTDDCMALMGTLKKNIYITNLCYWITQALTDETITLRNRICMVIAMIIRYCEESGIDILCHIKQKMKYNELRPRNNGKNY